MDELFSDVVAMLANFPYVGHLADIAGTREPIPHEGAPMAARTGWQQSTAMLERIFIFPHFVLFCHGLC